MKNASETAEAERIAVRSAWCLGRALLVDAGLQVSNVHSF
jgi:hypothetical protein